MSAVDSYDPSGLKDDTVDSFDAMKIISRIRRLLNTLKENDLQVRKRAIQEVKDTLDEFKLDMDSTDMESILLEFSKILLQCFADPSEKIREASIQIYLELLARSRDILPYLKYIFEILVQRLNCTNLEGTEGMDPRMIPTPSQKPHRMVKLVEESEVVRETLLELAKTLVEVMSPESMREYIDDTIAILSVLLMDPYDQIQIKACKLVSEFVVSFRELVFHFTVKLARSLLLPLTAKKSSVKIAAIQALHDVLFCGTWKYTSDVFDILVGFKDPNYVAIKEFYEPSHGLNYLATLINSPNPSVREAFLQMVCDLLIALPDRVDIETRLIPYFLTGLFDDFAEIREFTLGIIEEVGLAVEREKEKDFREIKQLGYHPEWSYEGKIITLPLPEPFKERPRLGSRNLVKGHFLRLTSAISRELKDRIGIANRLRAAKLLE